MVALVGAFFIFIWPLLGLWLYNPEVGDVVFQPLPLGSDLVKAIEGTTHSSLSHCGVITKRNNQWYVIEALEMVRYQPLYQWIKQGRLSRFAVYRLDHRYKPQITNFIEKVKMYENRPYDSRYRMDDEKIYCSELVYKAFRDATGEELGKLVSLGQLDWKPYADIIRKYEGGALPLNRTMITPRHLSEAFQLHKVFGWGL